MRFSTDDLRILSLVPGRLRVHLPNGCERSGPVEERLRRLSGVSSVRTSRLTGNALICFDPRRTTVAALLDAIEPGAGRHYLAEQSRRTSAPSSRDLVRAGVRGLVGHALLDAAFYALTFTQPFGLPLAGLGALHLGLDLAAWTAALAPLLGQISPPAPPPARGSSPVAPH